MQDALSVSLGDPWGQAVAICRGRSGDTGELNTPGDDRIAVAMSLAPDLFSAGPADQERAMEIQRSVLDAVYSLGKLTDQAAYEQAHEELAGVLGALDQELSNQRFLGGDRLSFADVLLFTFSVRLDPVYYELYKASVGLLADFPSLQDHARDLYELPEFYTTTDFAAIKAHHYLDEPVLNARSLVPVGGLPDLDAPHPRAEQFSAPKSDDEGTEENQDQRRGQGEWVRPQSRMRDWISTDGSSRYPAESGRYHLYAPFNCPWSHRALLARAVKGLEDVVGASIVYFRRDPDNGWQFNPAIPGCTADLVGGRRYVIELYQSVESTERSVPVLWDTETNTIVSNESAEILRMFNDAFGELAKRDLDLYPAGYREEIDRLNGLVYQRINNGAYKAGFARSQRAYEHAFARYFRMLAWLEERLGSMQWLAGTEHPSEADLRLFPTVYRHDPVYYARFKLNQRRIADYPRLSSWIDRMLEVPGIAEASNRDHSRNGYFGRSGNEIVPAGPTPLQLSPKDFEPAVWLNQA